MKFIVLLTLLGSLVWGRHVALLVETSKGKPLYTEKDIVSMKRLLGDRYEFVVLGSNKATSHNIRKAFKKLSKELTSSDTFVFFYSGHGDRFDSGDSSEDDGSDDFLLTSDYNCKMGSRVVNVLVDDELNYLYSIIKARKVVLIDACHSSSMDKAVSVNNSKHFKGCGGGLSVRGFEIDPKFTNARASNILHFGASNEDESALGSKNGGVFTLALAKVLGSSGNISFGELEQRVQRQIKRFTPSISYASDINKDRLYTKDIFATPKEKLKSLLDRNIAMRVETQENISSYPLGKRVDIKAYLNYKSNQNLYLIELKEDDSYRVISAQPHCLKYSKYGYTHRCGFRDLTAIEPLGVSQIYVVQSNKKLQTTKDISVIPRNVMERLEGMSIQSGSIAIETSEK